MQKELVAYLFVLSVFLAACVAEEPVLPSPQVTRTIIPTSVATPKKIATPVTIVNPLPVKQTVDGITIELIGYKQEYDLLIIEFCFTPPSADNWLFDEILLIVDNHEIPPKEQRYNSGRSNGFSCGSLSFPIDQNIKSGNIELMIGQLQTDVIHPDCVKAQKKLDEAKPVVAVKVECFSNGDEWGYHIETTEKPENMSDEEVADLVKDAFSDTIQINLRFSFRVENR